MLCLARSPHSELAPPQQQLRSIKPERPTHLKNNVCCQRKEVDNNHPFYHQIISGRAIALHRQTTSHLSFTPEHSKERMDKCIQAPCWRRYRATNIVTEYLIYECRKGNQNVLCHRILLWWLSVLLVLSSPQKGAETAKSFTTCYSLLWMNFIARCKGEAISCWMDISTTEMAHL